MACEKCWNDAWMWSQINGKSQAENYADLLLERKDNPCGPEWETEAYFKPLADEQTKETKDV